MAKAPKTKPRAKDFDPQTAWRSLDTITPYVHNAKKHPEEQVARLAGIIAETGWDQPIVVDQDGVIIKGHGRRLAALRLGLERVPVIVRTDLSPDQVKAARIADNKLAETEWDLPLLQIDLRALEGAGFDMPMLGFGDALAGLLAPAAPEPNAGNGDPDEVPEPPKEPRSRPGDLWLCGEHRLLCGDSTNVDHVERVMGGSKADLWLVDPPYGVSMQAKNAALAIAGKSSSAIAARPIENDDHELDEMAVFWTDLAATALVVCSDKAPYYWFACQGGDQMMMMMMSISRAGWKVRHELIWVKDQFVLGRCDYHYKHEPILYGWKQKGTHEFYGGRAQTSVLEFPRPRSNDIHPTMKPVDLLVRLIENSAAPGALVLDSCGGSGSTMIACEKSGRRARLIEIDPRYVDAAVARWEKFTGRKAKLAAAIGTVGEDAAAAPASGG